MTKAIKVIQSMICDNCGKKMEYDTIEVSFGYPSKCDMHNYDFCSDKCLKAWVNKNINEKEVKSKKGFGRSYGY